MTNSHESCTHPATKAARARCRKDRAQHVIDHAMEIEYNRLVQLAEDRHEARKGGGFMTTAQHALAAGAENADDSLEDLKIIQYSEYWYSLAISGFWSVMNSTWGGDLRWAMNVDYATAEEIENAPYTMLDD